jgi:hypothetical protein
VLGDLSMEVSQYISYPKSPNMQLFC